MLLQNLKDHGKHGSSQPKIKGQPTVSSMVIVVEEHSPSSRAIILQNIMVSWNGEEIMHWDPFGKEAMMAYRSHYKIQRNSEGNFVRGHDNIMFWYLKRLII